MNVKYISAIFTQISVSPNDKVWGVNRGHGIYRYLGSNRWQGVDGRLKVVSVGPSGVWGVNSGNAIYYRKGTYANDNTRGHGVNTFFQIS